MFSTSLSNEMKIASDTFGLSHKQLIDLCNTAVDVSFATDSEKVKLKEQISAYAQTEAV